MVTIYSIKHFTLIAITGEKSESFLQGQLTCDVAALKENDSTLAACCDHKGRVISNFWLLRTADNFLIVLPALMRDIVISHLKKYAVFSKVTVEPSDDWQILITENSIKTDDNITNHYSIFFNQQFQIVITKSNDLYLINEIAFEKHIMQAGLAFIYPETSLLFTPQMLNLEKFNAISLNKGCYVGQEIIARTHYLGKLKRHLQCVSLTVTDIPVRGSALSNQANEKIGVVVSAIKANEETVDVLAVIEDRFL